MQSTGLLAWYIVMSSNVSHQFFVHWPNTNHVKLTPQTRIICYFKMQIAWHIGGVSLWAGSARAKLKFEQSVFR